MLCAWWCSFCVNKVNTCKLFVIRNADNEKSETCIMKSRFVVNAIKIHQSKEIQNDGLWGRELI